MILITFAIHAPVEEKSSAPFAGVLQMCPYTEITQPFLHLLFNKWLAACPRGSFRIASVSMQIQGCVACGVYFGFLNYCISNEIKMSLVLHDNRFFLNKTKKTHPKNFICESDQNICLDLKQIKTNWYLCMGKGRRRDVSCVWCFFHHRKK